MLPVVMWLDNLHSYDNAKSASANKRKCVYSYIQKKTYDTSILFYNLDQVSKLSFLWILYLKSLPSDQFNQSLLG